MKDYTVEASKFIESLLADGYTPAQITNYLNGEGMLNHNGCAFHRGSVTRLLRNPAYKGDFIAQQYYVNEERRLVKNTGEKPMLLIEDDHIPIVTRDLWDRVQVSLDAVTHKAAPTESKPLPLTIQNYPYKDLLFCAKCGHRLNRAVRAGRVLWECNGKTRFSKSFCEGITVTDDEVKAFLPISEPIYISPVIDRGKTVGHTFQVESEWSATHSKKKHISSAPALTLENYPYKDSIYCKYCGSKILLEGQDAEVLKTKRHAKTLDGLKEMQKEYHKDRERREEENRKNTWTAMKMLLIWAAIMIIYGILKKQGLL